MDDTIERRWGRRIAARGIYSDPVRSSHGHFVKGRWNLDIIKRSDKTKGFGVLPRRWVVERTFTWLGRRRRVAKDWENTIASATAFLVIAHIRLLTRRIARHCYA